MCLPIFEEFVQVPNRLQPSVRGTGLGLPYARRTSQALGGTLTSSSVLGAGSVFTLRLPSLAPATQTQDAAPRPPQEDARGHDLGHVLIVDDDRAFAAVLVAMLQAEAVRVSVAHDASHALALLHDGAADLALLDVRLPGMDGPTLRSRIQDLYPGTATVLMSSTTLPAGEDLASVPFLPKAHISRDHLVATLRRAREAR